MSMSDNISPEIEESALSDVMDEVKEPPMYRVILHNDDYTTMEFVIEILMTVFQKSMEEAILIMLNVHRQGTGICGLYTLEVAETKMNSVHAIARESGFPLRCTVEKE
ncbi:MAG: ATP-dependent Clp protease adaptor protein ClpS [Thermodesulfobacteriota bacterium]|nr:ATP-dependent Clp protease adaptor protein ClpS [Thermodesulfobacteriota bacterium]